MNLQIEMIALIDSIGRKKLIDRLNFCSRMVSTRDQEYFKNLASYFDSLYKSALSEQENPFQYKKEMKATIEILKKYNRALNCNLLSFSKNLLEYRLEAEKRLKSAS